MSIPEMNEAFVRLEKEAAVLPVTKINEREFAVSASLLKKLHLSPKRFERMVKDKTDINLSCQDTGDKLLIHMNEDNLQLPFF